MDTYLQRLCAEHADAILAFETVNRAYFAASISDRGDDFFRHFDERIAALLADQAAGAAAYHVLVDGEGDVLGRFNLIFAEEGVAELGYRVAQRAAGRGVATAAVAELCALAATDYHLKAIRAATSHSNVASQRVLLKAGFQAVGPADPSEIGGKTGTWYYRDL